MKSSGPSSGVSPASYQSLVAWLKKMGGAVVAFSGGVDSSLVLAAAVDGLGRNAVAVTACSPTYPAHEQEQAVTLARLLGARHELIDSAEVENPAFRANPPDRCYHCKRELFRKLAQIATNQGLGLVVDGSNADDESDYRPGSRAAREFRIRSPLAELGYTKADVRRLARERGLPNWDQPACACLASRIPYGEEITAARLERVANAEAKIRGLGFRMVRVRDHGELARIEVGRDELELLLAAGMRQSLVNACKEQGYTFVCLDLEGYRTGSLNEVLVPPDK
jgi:uncharacterized protein